MTRVFTQPFRERFRDTRGITGATMEDGTVYRARPGGVMTVDRDDHLAAMKRDPRVAENIAVETFHGPIMAGRYCPVCNFSAWPWQAECPRDGTPTEGD